MIYQPGFLQRDDALPRDVLAEFPFAQLSPRMKWYQIVESGETWTDDLPNGDFVVTYGNIGLEFECCWDAELVSAVTMETEDVMSQVLDSGTVIFPDITIPKTTGIVWKVAPETEANWLLRWTFSHNP